MIWKNSLKEAEKSSNPKEKPWSKCKDNNKDNDKTRYSLGLNIFLWTTDKGVVFRMYAFKLKIKFSVEKWGKELNIHLTELVSTWKLETTKFPPAAEKRKACAAMLFLIFSHWEIVFPKTVSYRLDA